MKRKKQKKQESVPLPLGRVLTDLRTGAPMHPIALIHPEDVPYRNISSKVKVLRYLDFWKFESLLATSSLYFARPDCFEDQFEGRMTHSDPNISSKSDQELGRHMRFVGGLESQAHEIQRMVNFILCWHMNDQDSMKMWNEYTGSPDSVVVFSKVGLLTGCMPENVFSSGVKYQDTSSPRTELDGRSLFFFKPTHCAFEREFRMMREPLPGEEFNSEDKGRTINISLGNIIRKIVIHPQATPEFQRKVHAVVKEYLPILTAQTSKLAPSDP